jgi:F-type H+-transporting ATPase subunit gamma
LDALLPLQSILKNVDENGEKALSEAEAARLEQTSYVYEPSEHQILDILLPRAVATHVQRSLLESIASENGARMTAMDSASKNAVEMIGRLTLQYNRARQAAITTELIEVISGAESL